VEDAPAAVKKSKDESGAATPAGGANAEGGCTVFIKGLPFAMEEKDLREAFGDAGAIASVDMLTFPDTGRFRGLARVTYETAAGATKSLEWNNTDFGGRSINVEINQGRPSMGGAGASAGKTYPTDAAEPSNTVFLGNLAFTVTDDQIYEAFGVCGTVTSVRLATDRETGQPRGFGHCEFETVEAATAAVAMTGVDVSGRGVRVTFAAARAPREGGGDRGGRGGGRGGFGGDRGGRGGGRGGFGGDRGGRGGRGGFGAPRGGARGGFGAKPERKEGIKEFAGAKMSFD